ncbi:hypothetical protein L6164_019869 [Bauhinia variegata]|nr:hypothetical protein L6164_019869 [Bauhinia variegata]
MDVADDHGIHCALLWIQCCAIYSIYYRYFKNIDNFPNLEDPNESVQLPGMPVLEVRDLPSFMLPSSPPIFAEVLLKLFRDLDKKVNWVLGSSFYEIEEDIVKSMASLTPIYPIGPLVSPFLLGEKENDVVNVDMWNAEDSCLEWLDNKPPSSVIYISFGSILVLSQKQIDNIAMALKNSNKAFLWVIKPAEEGSEGNGGVLRSDFLEETKGNGLVVKWCPQEKVLMHPAIACFVTHCGWNSTLETLVTGVPVIAHPEWTDQPTNAKLLVNAFKVGVKINFDEDGTASTQEMERCIREIMEGPRAAEIKNRARELKEAAKKALEDGGSSARNINQFISEIAGKH